MNQSKGGGKVAFPVGPPIDGGSPSVKGKVNEGSTTSKGSPNLDQLSHDVADFNIDSVQDSGWEVVAKKLENRTVATNAKPWGSSTDAPNAWGHLKGIPAKAWGSNSEVGRNPGNNWDHAIDSCKPAAYTAQPHVILPPLVHGWQGTNPKTQEDTTNAGAGKDSVAAYDSEFVPRQPNDVSEDDDDDELLDDSDDDLSDDYDSDASQKSHETRKKNKWLKPVFEALDNLKVEQIHEQSRQWHCPACHDGPGAIGWYKGLQPLLTHAKTKGTVRVRLHRELALLLEEELLKRGTSVMPAGEAFGKWKGLRETTADHEIVWPPMVVIMNTLLEKDEDDKWGGMGNPELVDYFSTYAVVRARHSYGPNGHRGMSVLIFDASAMGYLEAEHLHKQFADEGRDRDAWERRRVVFYPGGKRQLYGYLASKEDMNIFNQHSAEGRSGVKFEMKSYQEMVVVPMREMSEDKQLLIWLKNRVVKEEQRSKALGDGFGVVSQKLRETMEENRIVRLRTKMQQEENKEEMDYQEQFLKEQMDRIHKATEEKEQECEKLFHTECAKAKQSDVDSGTNEDRKQRKEEIESFIASQVKGVEEFEAEREILIRTHEEKKVEMKHKHLEEEVELEKEFDTALTKLMESYAPSTFQASNGA